MTAALIAIGAVLALAVLAWIVIRSRMIGTRKRVDESWSGIDVRLERRHAVVPDLVATVEGYAAHERQVLESLTQARAEAVEASGPSEAGPAEGRLAGALARVQAVAEHYPQLRTSETFQELQRDLTQIEDEIQAARRIYNANVQTYNAAIQIFPNAIVAGLGGFAARGLFELGDPAERRQPAGEAG